MYSRPGVDLMRIQPQERVNPDSVRVQNMSKQEERQDYSDQFNGGAAW